MQNFFHQQYVYLHLLDFYGSYGYCMVAVSSPQNKRLEAPCLMSLCSFSRNNVWDADIYTPKNLQVTTFSCDIFFVKIKTYFFIKFVKGFSLLLGNLTLDVQIFLGGVAGKFRESRRYMLPLFCNALVLLWYDLSGIFSHLKSMCPSGVGNFTSSNNSKEVESILIPYWIY